MIDPDAFERYVQSMPVELRGERIHVSCMTAQEQRLTVFFLNRDRMAGRICGRCEQPFEAMDKPSQLPG
jgi:hypothetical protein